LPRSATGRAYGSSASDNVLSEALDARPSVPQRCGLHRPPIWGDPGGQQAELTILQLPWKAGYSIQVADAA
jgi:hypothetical protein